MFDLLKAASIAALMVAGTSAAGVTAPAPAQSTLSTVSTEPLPPTPAVEPLPYRTPETADSGEAIEPEVQLPAASLAALVRRNANSEPANAEMECLAGAVYFESKGEPLDGQLAVANVILNRTESNRFPHTVCGVLRQAGQFSFMRGGLIPAVPRSSAAWRDAVAIAHVAKAQLWQPVAKDALFFHARRVSPGWRMQRVASVGNHVFYR